MFDPQQEYAGTICQKDSIQEKNYESGNLIIVRDIIYSL